MRFQPVRNHGTACCCRQMVVHSYASASLLHHHLTTQATTSHALARMAHRFRGFCLGWRRAEMLSTLPHSKIQGRGARGAYGGSRYALRFTLQPLFLLRPCPAPCALKVAGESGHGYSRRRFDCYRLELARRSHHLRRGANFGRCRRCHGSTIVFWLRLSVLPHC